MAAETGKMRMSIKLLVDTKKNVVVFAEAGKEFVDLLFHILSLPMATVTRLLTKNAMVGSLGNLYDSFQTLDRSYLDISNKTIPLKINAALLLPSSNSADSINTYYRCCGLASDCRDYISGMASTMCPGCNKRMKRKVKLVSGGGYVKEVVTFIVMDNLVVKQLMSTISSITHLLNQSNVHDLSVVEEKTVEFGFERGVQLLETSLKSTTVLTDVFLRELSSLRSVGQNTMEEEEHEQVEEEHVDDDDDDDDDEDDDLSDDYYSDDDDDNY